MNHKEIEAYISELQSIELKFRNQNNTVYSDKKKNNCKNLIRVLRLSNYIILSIIDFISLFLLVRLNRNLIKNKRIVYTGKGSCIEKNGLLEDRIVRPLFTENIIFINTHKEIRLKKVNNQKVYNLGGVVKLISYLFYRKRSYLMRIFGSYSLINDLIIRQLKGNEVYMICLWELNTLSLVFSKYRSNIKLIKVQHGSMINYPPYVKPAPVKIADLFYVKNQLTIDYLKSHLCALYPTEYRLIPYPENRWKYVPGLHLLYASTLELNGLHAVFWDFLVNYTHDDLHIIIRLHPREREKEHMFAKELSGLNINYEFDQSQNWLEGNKIRNLIVISPWSSTLEDAYDNGFIAVTIDIVGKERFKHLIDNVKFFYSDELAPTIDYIMKEKLAE